MNIRTFLRTFVGISAISLLIGCAVPIGKQGTAAEAEAMVKRAVAYIEAVGPGQAYDEFTNGKSFKDRDLYVSVLELNGKNLAHGANPKLVGMDLIGLKDPDGKPLVQMLIEVAKNNDRGWSETYKFRHPITGEMAEKLQYVERVGNTLVAVGIYK